MIARDLAALGQPIGAVAVISRRILLWIGQKKVAEVIDPDLLKALQREIDSQNERLIHALSSQDVSDNEKEKAVEAARLQICHFLKQVLNFNDGVLPTKRLQNLWTSNRCGT